MKLPLTPAQKDVLDQIDRYIFTHGYPPTIRDLNALNGWNSPNAAMRHIRELRRKGYLKPNPEGRARALVIQR